MTELKSQSQSFCPENCHFCEEGLGLFYEKAAVNFPALSCHLWLQQDNPPSQAVFIPAKLLGGSFERRRLSRLQPSHPIIVLIGDNDFTPSSFLEIEKRPLEIWVIPSRRLDVLKVVERIPASLREKVYFYCPLYDPFSDRFLTAQELHRLFQKVKKRFPEIRISPPPGVDIYNATLDPVDVMTREEAVIESFEKNVEISVVIPSYNNIDYLEKVLQSLRVQDTRVPYEVIVVDDGSTDQTLNRLTDEASRTLWPEKLSVIHFPRPQGRQRGDFHFRAGAARNRGVQYAKGNILAFLDSDILVPPNYVQSLFEDHQHYEVVQIQRLYLKEKVSREISGYGKICEAKDVFHPEGGYWKIFFSDQRPWQEMPHYWKYACTYGLSVKASLYRELGGFRKVFNSYGFEDTDLGYRLAKKGARFLKSSLKGYHLWHEPMKSEFGNSAIRRRALLSRSANIFYRHHLDAEVFRELRTLLTERRFLKNRLYFWKKHEKEISL